ncbi:MAG: YCF48-related protein [Saprospiraceae bacterium]|jgi:photosystem II stability/assembly factor-like uncharacterized protein|nr:YCF48-related protein [Saprospiraceae bacterium]
MKTTDGGQTWLTQFNTPNYYLRSIEFVDAQTGYCGSLDGAFLKTTDGGETWNDIAPTIPGAVPGICGISHVGTEHVYGVGIWSFPAYFVKSSDGGNTWQYKDMSEHAIALIDPVFFHPDSGFVAGQDDDGGNILFTADGGETWEEVHNTGLPGEYVWKLQMLGRDTLFAAVENFGPSGSILASYDGGKNWVAKQFPFNGNIQAIGFVNGSRGWVGGYFNGFYETTDGGDTWLNVGIGSTLNRIFVLNEYLAFATGTSIYKYTDTPPSAVSPGRTPSLDWDAHASNGGQRLHVRVNLPRVDNVTLGLYSLEGRLIRHVFKGRLQGGTHEFEEDLQLPRGHYLVGLQINEGLGAIKLTISNGG